MDSQTREGGTRDAEGRERGVCGMALGGGGRQRGGDAAVRAAGVAAPFVDADLDRVSVGLGAPAAGPDHDGSGFCDVGGLLGRRVIMAR